jgi:hypothetical protein
MDNWWLTAVRKDEDDVSGAAIGRRDLGGA